MMGPARSAMDEHEQRSFSLDSDVQFCVAHIDAALVEALDPAAPAEGLRNLSEQLQFDMGGSIQCGFPMSRLLEPGCLRTRTCQQGQYDQGYMDKAAQ